MSKNIYWRDLKPQHKVVTRGREFRTAGGDSIYWYGQEAATAQHYLSARAAAETQPLRGKRAKVKRIQLATKCQFSAACNRNATHFALTKDGDFCVCAPHAKAMEKYKGVRYTGKL